MSEETKKEYKKVNKFLPENQMITHGEGLRVPNLEINSPLKFTI